MRIKELYIYPIKGMLGVSLDKSIIVDTGLEHDRRYMLADAKEGSLISQRNMSELTQMRVSRVGTAWRVHYQKEQIDIVDGSFTDEQLEVEVWDNRFVCNEVSESHSAWFSRNLKKEVKLVAMPSVDTRIKQLKIDPFKTPVSFADGYPILTVGTKSIDFLNKKLTTEIDVNRFRANIIIETTVPHEEDLWTDFQIGDQCRFRNIKPCVRCEVITIDQTTGVKGKEPNTTLAKYRNFKNEIYFGSNVIVLNKGEINVGDEIKLMGTSINYLLG